MRCSDFENINFGNFMARNCQKSNMAATFWQYSGHEITKIAALNLCNAVQIYIPNLKSPAFPNECIFFEFSVSSIAFQKFCAQCIYRRIMTFEKNITDQARIKTFHAVFSIFYIWTPRPPCGDISNTNGILALLGSIHPISTNWNWTVSTTKFSTS